MKNFIEQALSVASEPPGVDHSDEILMEMIQLRTGNSLELLHARYGRLLKAMSMKVLNNNADAEDLLQDVFVEIWNRAGNYNPLKGKPLAWIATLTRNRSIDRLRRRNTYCHAQERYAEESKNDEMYWTQIHEGVVQSECCASLQRAMSTLPEAQKNAVTLAFFKQMSHREIAAHTGVALGTIKTRLALALRKMATTMQEFHDFA